MNADSCTVRPPFSHASFWLAGSARSLCVGPGATPSELILQLLPSVGAAVAAPLYAATLPIDWDWWQLGLISILGFDLVGGILTNATAAAKRWYHRSGQGWRQNLSFVAVHLWLFRICRGTLHM